MPAGYLGPTNAEEASVPSDRDRTLLRLAQQAAMRHEQEVTLDDDLVASLSGAAPGDPVQPSAELTVRVHAASIPDLDEGRFTLHVLGLSRAAGTAAGRAYRVVYRIDEPARTPLPAAGECPATTTRP